VGGAFCGLHKGRQNNAAAACNAFTLPRLTSWSCACLARARWIQEPQGDENCVEDRHCEGKAVERCHSS